MMETIDAFESWFDEAMTDCGQIEAPPGFEARTIATLHQQRSRRHWLGALSLTAALTAAVFPFVVYGLFSIHPDVQEPPLVQTRIHAPSAQRVPLRSPVRHPHLRAAENSRRGVPIIVPPLTAQEEAILRLARNSAAKQLASIGTNRDDLTAGSQPLEIQALQIPPVGREEEK
jgi:hypothetical protein